jgi:hypothetical protein
MNEEEWLASTDPRPMLIAVWRCSRSTDRVRRLLGCACCRRVWHLFADARSRWAIEMVERFADGDAELEALVEAEAGAKVAWDEEELKPPGWSPSVISAMVACKVAKPVAAHGPRDAIDYLAIAADYPHHPSDRDRATERAGQADLLRDVFGPWPFRPPTLDPSVLAWNGGAVRSLAQAAYDERQLPSGHLDRDRLLVLADALEEAGADAEVLSHLRGPGPHVRGCWALDLLTGRE